MNSTTNPTNKIRDIHSALEKDELQLLRERVNGYGWLSDSARKVGLHTNTIKGIIRRGYGRPDSVNRIRNILLA
jgi:hypothetical protein